MVQGFSDVIDSPSEAFPCVLTPAVPNKVKAVHVWLRVDVCFELCVQKNRLKSSLCACLSYSYSCLLL